MRGSSIECSFAKGPAQLEARRHAKVASIATTETEAVVRRWPGQALFRDAALDYLGGSFAGTCLDVRKLLRSSHAKPIATVALTGSERLGYVWLDMPGKVQHLPEHELEFMDKPPGAG